MFSSARGMAICIGVTGVASILLWFYFKNRIENVESKLDSMFEMIQNFSEDSTSTQQTQIYNEKQDDPFENKELEFVNQMKNPFYVLNTSRGKVISNNALIDGLKSKKILGAGLDVIENENSSFSNITIDENLNYLLSCNNVILTPHIAGLSKESNKKLSTVLIDKILEIK